MVFIFVAIAGKAAKIRIFKLGLKWQQRRLRIKYFKQKA